MGQEFQVSFGARESDPGIIALHEAPVELAAILELGRRLKAQGQKLEDAKLCELTQRFADGGGTNGHIPL